MAILRMKRIRIIGETKDRAALLSALMKFGCVELSELPPPGEEDGGIASDRASPDRLHKLRESFEEARGLLDRYAKAEKAPLFAMPRKVGEAELLNPGFLEGAAQKAGEIVAIGDEAERYENEISRLSIKRMGLIPWREADIPLNTGSGRSFEAVFGVCPSAVSLEAFKQRLSEEAPECSITEVSSDRDQRYLFLIMHRSASSAAGAVFRDYAFSRSDFSDLSGTAAENIKAIEKSMKMAEEARDKSLAEIDRLKDSRETIEQAIDAISVLIDGENMRESLLVTGRAFYGEGWVPEERTPKLLEFLEKNDYAYELEDPSEEDDVPIGYKNNRFVEPYETIINLYGVPQYEEGRGIDATAATAPFFALFFGMMLSDAGYGLILLALSLFVIFKVKPERGSFMQRVFSIGIACGITTVFWGALFGGWFGNAAAVVASTFFGSDFAINPIWFDPLQEPMTLLILGFALGFIHIAVGMGLSAVRNIREGKPLDALFDTGFWYILLISLVLMLLGIPYAQYGALAGAAGVVLTGGRSSKGILGKLSGGLGSLYGISGYLSDVLSYSRLLALGLATGVVANVINTMGAMGGKSVVSAIVYVAVFIGGHAFNLAINLLGSYVHSSRLQYVEFYNKFFVSGGRLFSPAKYKTKYVQIIKEEM